METLFHHLLTLIPSVLLPGIVLFFGLIVVRFNTRQPIRPLVSPLTFFLIILGILSVIASIVAKQYVHGTYLYEGDQTFFFSLLYYQYPDLSTCPSWVAYGVSFFQIYWIWISTVVVLLAISSFVTYLTYRSHPQIRRVLKIVLIFSGLWILLATALGYPYQGQMSPTERRQLCSFERVGEQPRAENHYYLDEFGVVFSTNHTADIVFEDRPPVQGSSNDRIVITLPEASPSHWDTNPNNATITMEWYTQEEWMSEQRSYPQGQLVNRSSDRLIAHTHESRWRQWNTDRGTLSEFVIYPYNAYVVENSDKLLRITVEPYMSDEIRAILDSLYIDHDMSLLIMSKYEATAEELVRAETSRDAIIPFLGEAFGTEADQFAPVSCGPAYELDKNKIFDDITDLKIEDYRNPDDPTDTLTDEDAFAAILALQEKLQSTYPGSASLSIRSTLVPHVRSCTLPNGEFLYHLKSPFISHSTHTTLYIGTADQFPDQAYRLNTRIPAQLSNCSSEPFAITNDSILYYWCTNDFSPDDPENGDSTILSYHQLDLEINKIVELIRCERDPFLSSELAPPRCSVYTPYADHLNAIEEAL